VNILFLTSRLPYPPHRGDKLKIYNLIKQLSRRGHEITLISFIASKKEKENIKPLMEFCVDVKIILLRPVNSFFNCMFGLFSSLPFQVLYFSSKKMSRLISSELALKKHELIHVHLIRMAQYAEETTEPKRVLDLTDAGSLYLERFFRSTKNPFMRAFLKTELGRLKRYERILEQFDVSLVCSEVDKNILQARAPQAHIDLLQNGIDLEYFSANGMASPIPGRIIYTGNMSYYPNIDGALYFIKEIFPKIRKAFANAKLHIVGQNPSSVLKRLGGEDVVVTGFVPDIKAEYLQSAIAVAPIRFGAGTLNKILEPMALGIPVVATSIAMEGLPVQHGRDILVADSPDDFAQSVILLLNDEKLQRMLGANAQSVVRNLYDWKRIAIQLEKIYKDALVTTESG
jgi:sugar transferase (PEP-CTERM/EpsH1 system associated)